jgi:hypothetical protein
MHFFLGAVLGACYVASVAAKGAQIPVVDGVIGGVPVKSTAKDAQVEEDVTTQATTPGALRVTENSGVCGMLP